MTILWFGLGLCICLFILFCILSALDTNIVDVSKELPKPDTPSKPNAPKVEEKPVNTSEPVLSFVEVVRKQPQRFVVSSIPKSLVLHRPFEIKDFYYAIQDTKTGEKWNTDSRGYIAGLSSHSWLTEDEMAYLVKEITAIYEARKDRVEKLKTLRKQRRDKQERSRLMKIYAEGIE